MDGGVSYSIPFHFNVWNGTVDVSIDSIDIPISVAIDNPID
jgi:hypothetical protein